MDLNKMMTETRNPDTMDLDEMSALEIVTAMNREDRKVPEGIEPVLPQGIPINVPAHNRFKDFCSNGIFHALIPQGVNAEYSIL